MSIIGFEDPFFKSAFPLARSSSMDLMRKGMPMDMRETADSFVAKVDMPGLQKEDIHVNFEKDVMTISADFKKEVKKEDDKVHWEERSTGHISRSIKFPEHIDVSNIKAAYDNGVLTVTVPKLNQEKVNKHKISVE